MLGGLGVAVYYLLSHVPTLQAAVPRWMLADGLWFGIQPVSAGVFGVPIGVLAAVVVSWMTRPVLPRPQPRTEL
jgi:cation/acetate symporter